MKSKSHWQNIFSYKKLTEMSWHQTHADKSLLLMDKTQLGTEAHIIDVGGGVSVLVDDLIARKYQNITVLDISGEALEQSKTRLGKAGEKVTWIQGDITTVDLPNSNFDIWHDRAVFHFLISAADRSSYLAQLQKALKANGFAIIATFNMNGPEKCSGLEVMRYSATSLSEQLGAEFTLIENFSDVHSTPWGSTQNFLYCLFQRQKGEQK